MARWLSVDPVVQLMPRLFLNSDDMQEQPLRMLVQQVDLLGAAALLVERQPVVLLESWMWQISSLLHSTICFIVHQSFIEHGR